MQFHTSTLTFTEMKLINDGDPILNGESVFAMGTDTVILLNVLGNILYICAHLKDYKPLEDAKGAFTKQLNSILNVVNFNKDKQIILMFDANTQFEIKDNSIFAFSKSNEKDRKEFLLQSGITISGFISSVPTSNKMRGPHTAQLNKMLDPVTATIDHVIVFNGPKVVDTKSYVLDSNGNLKEIVDSITLTTSPNSIVDHALVVSTNEKGESYASLNIKGGDLEDKAWAEFIPQTYYNFFNNPIVTAQLDELLTNAFNIYIGIIKSKNFLSTPRCKIFDINLSNKLIPSIVIHDENTVHVYTTPTKYIIISKNQSGQFVNTSETNEWINIFVQDLNNPECRQFMLERGYKLLNFWYDVQNDKTVLIDNMSLSSVYDEWRQSTTKKVSIAEMVRLAKANHPNLRVISLQEMPKDETAEKIIEGIDGVTFMSSNAPGSTRGAIIVFNN